MSESNEPVDSRNNELGRDSDPWAQAVSSAYNVYIGETSVWPFDEKSHEEQEAK